MPDRTEEAIPDEKNKVVLDGMAEALPDEMIEAVSDGIEEADKGTPALLELAKLEELP